MTNLVDELKKIIPADHPFFDKFEADLEPAQPRDTTDLVDAGRAVIEAIEDWKRGIRDWEEVSGHVDTLQAELLTFQHKETP